MELSQWSDHQLFCAACIKPYILAKKNYCPDMTNKIIAEYKARYANRNEIYFVDKNNNRLFYTMCESHGKMDHYFVSCDNCFAIWIWLIGNYKMNCYPLIQVNHICNRCDFEEFVSFNFNDSTEIINVAIAKCFFKMQKACGDNSIK